MRTPAQTLAANVRARRTVADLSQADLAEAMRALGHGWSRQTVGVVEGNARSVSTNELVGLALVLDAPVGELLDAGSEGLDYGGPDPMPPVVAQVWARSAVRLRWNGDRLVPRPVPAGLAEYLKEPEGQQRGRALIDFILEDVVGAPGVDRPRAERDAPPPNTDPKEGS